MADGAALHSEIREICATGYVRLRLSLEQHVFELGSDVPFVNTGFHGFTMQPRLYFACRLEHRCDDLRPLHVHPCTSLSRSSLPVPRVSPPLVETLSKILRTGRRPASSERIQEGFFDAELLSSFVAVSKIDRQPFQRHRVVSVSDVLQEIAFPKQINS